MKLKEILEQLESLKNPKNVLGMARFGIRPKTQVYGIATPKLRNMAGKIGKNNVLDLSLNKILLQIQPFGHKFAIIFRLTARVGLNILSNF